MSAWVNRKHGEVNFYLKQFLFVHGFYRKYLLRFGHASSSLCPECVNVEGTPEHVVFESRRCVGICVCRQEDTWNVVDRAVTEMLFVLQVKCCDDQITQVRDRGRLDPPRQI